MNTAAAAAQWALSGITAAALISVGGCTVPGGENFAIGASPTTAAKPASPGTPAPGWVPGDVAAYADALVSATNAARDAEGLEGLLGSACAREAAQQRAEALVGDEELVHAPLAPVIADCAPMTTAAENLVNSAATPEEVVDAWLGSPGHRANIVDPALTEIGIACVDDDGLMLCSQVFLGP
ncbi:CAP domain-containing protein [Georgenia faecalis]|uniref:CAP domain-containing protein n=1 Tax=Georgenia faecalis TaxID=2483799 RepID=UPI000FD7EE29|nr:CAP domain-containing protein [Georgenia faecalis]